jgi:hypothetical protein
MELYVFSQKDTTLSAYRASLRGEKKDHGHQTVAELACSIQVKLSSECDISVLFVDSKPT